jgi:hypothetical protein
MTEIEQAVASLKHLVECRCDEAYTGRGRHDPHSACDYADEVKIVVDHIADLEGALKAIAAEASVPVYTWKNGINFKKMYEGWRKIATSRIDIARSTIGEIKGEAKQLKMVLEREAETQARHDIKMDALEAKLVKAVTALTSIAVNTCCGGCQEAALVARAAIKGETK